MPKSLSRIGKMPVALPQGVKAEISGNEIKVTGPKGALSQGLHHQVKVAIDGANVVVEPVSDSREAKAYHGLYRSLINNMVIGVSAGYSKRLEIIGVGYRADLQGRILNLALGYSNPINFDLPDGIEAVVDRQFVTVSGIDKQLVGQVAANIRSLRPPEPYKGKGIKYDNETIRRKVGKAGAK